MNISESIKMALSSVLAHKMRSMLTMLGIIIGVGSIITIVAIGQMGEQQLKKSISGGNKNMVTIQYSATNADPMRSAFLTPPEIRPIDIERIQKLPYVASVIEQKYGSSKIAYVAKESEDISIRGADLAIFDLMNLKITAGRLISQQDINNASNVIVLGKETALQVFSSPEEAIGKIVDLQGHPARVIGVVEEQSTFGFTFKECYVPLTSWEALFPNSPSSSYYAISATDVQHIKEAGDNTTKYLNDTLVGNTEDAMFKASSVEQLEQQISSITGIMTAIIGGIAAISLLVGGIGVMNIMLVSVAERTREIGVRKALGATRNQILLQFLIESMVLTSLGGLIGILLAYGLTFLISVILSYEFMISIPIIVLAVLFSMIVGVAFGLLPANKAAKLNPIDALRYE